MGNFTYKLCKREPRFETLFLRIQTMCYIFVVFVVNFR